MIFAAVALMIEFAAGVDPMRSMGQDFDQCVRQPELAWCQVECNQGTVAPWCGAPVAIRSTRPITLREAVKIDSRARQAYRHREETRDKWEAKPEAVLSGGVFRGDCDDLTGTVAELLSREGAPNESLGRAIVRSVDWNKSDGIADHMIGLFTVDGEIYIVGDSEGQPAPLAGSGYTLVWHQWLSDGLAWRVGAITPPRPNS